MLRNVTVSALNKKANSRKRDRSEEVIWSVSIQGIDILEEDITVNGEVE